MGSWCWWEDKLLARGELFSARETTEEKPEAIALERGSYTMAITQGGAGARAEVGGWAQGQSGTLSDFRECIYAPSSPLSIR